MYLANSGRRITRKIKKKYDNTTSTPSHYVLHLQLTEDQSYQFDQYYETKMIDDGTNISRG